MALKKILEQSRYLVVIAVLCLLLAALAAFAWGAVKTWHVVLELFGAGGSDPRTGIHLVELMDTFLIATALLIFAHGLYELFIEPIEQPAFLVVHNLHDLKAKLASVMVLVLAVNFLLHFVEWKDPRETLYFGIAAALVSLSLVAFGHFGEKD